MDDTIRLIIIISAFLVIVSVILIVFLLLKVNKLEQFFSTKKFKALINYQINPINNNAKFVLKVFNLNLSDAKIVDFGIIYDHENITYFDNKIINKDNAANYITVGVRDYFSIEIDEAKLYDLILIKSNAQYKVKKTKLYVIDSFGTTMIMPAKELVFRIKKLMKADYELIKWQIRDSEKLSKKQLKSNTNVEEQIIKDSDEATLLPNKTEFIEAEKIDISHDLDSPETNICPVTTQEEEIIKEEIVSDEVSVEQEYVEDLHNDQDSHE